MDEQPAPHRLVWAFAAAPAAGALVIALGMAAVTGSLAGGLFIGGFGVALVGYPATLIVGLPAYLALRRRMRLTLVRCAVAGAAIAGVPLMIVMSVMMLADGASMRDLGNLLLPIGAAVAGAVGGLVFWAVAAWTPRRPV